jgi:hypothetical protein
MTTRDPKEPVPQPVRARDIQPYLWGQWCQIGDGEPFTNEIVSVRWAEDGKSLWLMLESHNFMNVGPDEVLQLVPLTPPERLHAAVNADLDLLEKLEAGRPEPRGIPYVVSTTGAQ